MHNWKWVNLSKIASFNYKLKLKWLNERQSSSNKKHNKSLRLVLFIPFRCCFTGSLPYFFIDSETNETIPLHFRNVFHFFSEKNSLSKTFLVDKCVRSGAASCNKRREFWRETRTPLWLLIGRIIFFTCENHCSLLWLAGTNLRTKIYDMAFWCVFLSMYKKLYLTISSCVSVRMSRYWARGQFGEYERGVRVRLVQLWPLDQCSSWLKILLW